MTPEGRHQVAVLIQGGEQIEAIHRAAGALRDRLTLVGGSDDGWLTGCLNHVGRHDP